MSSPVSPARGSKEPEISLWATLGRTAFLVTFTVALLALVRFWQPATALMQTVLRTTFWPRLYDWFHVETEIGREQILLVGIVLICFCVALGVQLAGFGLLRVLRRKKQGAQS